MRFLFLDLVEPRAIEFVARKVAKLNGDIRVAFDLMKGAFSNLALKVANSSEAMHDDEIRVTLKYILDVYEKKYGSKIEVMLKSQPIQHILILRAAVELFEYEQNEDRFISYNRLQQKVWQIGDEMCADRM
jgi:Cdc6-like AAA superfamily ATPase